jgi:molecular chaperone DnaK
VGRIIGIDLGTTKSVASVMIGGKPTIIPGRYGNFIPSVVLVTSKEEIFVGEMAKRHPEFNSGRSYSTIYSVKRLMGRSKEIRWGDLKTLPQEVSAFILAELKKQAESFLGEKVDKAVITVPSSFNENQRRATKEAGEIAGLEVVRLLNEPTAAAFAYAIDRSEKELKIMVFDFGGGTLDVTIMDLGGGVFQVKSTAGDTELGGIDMDEAIIKYILEEFKKETGIDLRNDNMAMIRIREEAEKAKIELSSVLETQINLPFITVDAMGPKHLLMNITRAKLDLLVEPIVNRSSGPMEKAITDAGLTPQQIDKIILVGGATRMPIVQKFISDYTGKRPQGGVDPMECVAMGAAIQAGIIEGNVKNVVLVDVVPLSLGIETLGGKYTKLIDRNSPMPTTKSQFFTTTSDNQTQIEINVLQGERPLANDNISVGRFIFDGIMPATKGVPQVKVTYTIDENGILHTTAKDKATGKEHHATVNSPYRLNDAQIKVMKQKLKSWSSDMNFYELKHLIKGLRDSINQLLAKEANALDWEDVLSLKRCVESIDSLQKKQLSYEEIENSLSSINSIYDRALQNISYHEKQIGNINTLIDKIAKFAPILKSANGKESDILEQGKKLLEDALKQNLPLEMIEQIAFNIRSGYEEAKASLIEKAVSNLANSSGFRKWTEDLESKTSNLSFLSNHFLKMNEFKEADSIANLLRDEDNETLKSLQQKTILKLNGRSSLKYYFFLIIFVNFGLSKVFDIGQFTSNEGLSSFMIQVLFYGLDGKNRSDRRLISDILASELPIDDYFALFVDLIIDEKDEIVKNNLIKYVDRHNANTIQYLFLRADSNTKSKMSTEKEILVRLMQGPDEKIVLIAFSSFSALCPDEALSMYNSFSTNRSSNARTEAFQVLISNLRQQSQVLETVNQALEDVVPDIRYFALEFIDKNRDASFTQRLLSLLYVEQNQKIKEKIIDALGNFKNKNAAYGLLKSLTYKDKNTVNLILSAVEKNLALMDKDFQKLYQIIEKTVRKKTALSLMDKLFINGFSRKHPETNDILQMLKNYSNELGQEI